MIHTKDKIIEAAERLFAEQGYASTSLRQIIAEAAVNLASVHYHFGSKERLLDDLVHRKADPVNQARLSLLDASESKAAGRPLSVEQILNAFLLPTAKAASADPTFVRLMGRIHAEGLMPAIVQKHFLPTAQRFVSALRRALPDLPEAEFLWRVHFMMGAMSYTMCGTPIFPAAIEDFHSRMEKLVRFLSAGFRAPAGNGEEKPA
ncbi:MAG TPA: TetR/AcrR family transcriptional regulator [Candidatus Acidoferrales bacterium]|nr:TetR/AcrR family transcriptional regulator [Candidatus Acidoferrales bacterium]